MPAALERVAELAGLKVTDCRPIGQGRENRCWRVRSAAGDWVVRLNGAAGGWPQPELDREFECRVARAAAQHGLAPPVIACDPQGGYLITGYIDEPVWTAECFSDASAVAALARSLRELHAMQEPAAEAVDWRGELVSLAAEGPLRENAAVKDGIGRLLEDLDQTGFSEGPLALCHHDLHAANILGQAPVRFVDFEYARWTHPAMDIAWLIQYHDLVPEQCDLLLSAYYGRTGPDVARFIALAVRLAQYQELLWLVSRDAPGRLTADEQSRLRALRLVLT